MTPGSPSKEERDDAKGPEPSSPTRGSVTTRVSVPSSGIPEAAPTACVSATHTVLFEPEGPRCDVCDTLLTAEEAADDPYEVAGGRGLYLWVRHGEVVYEEPPLCTSCGAAITMTAFQRWFIEEEEG